MALEVESLDKALSGLGLELGLRLEAAFSPPGDKVERREERSEEDREGSSLASLTGVMLMDLLEEELRLGEGLEELVATDFMRLTLLGWL